MGLFAFFQPSFRSVAVLECTNWTNFYTSNHLTITPAPKIRKSLIPNNNNTFVSIFSYHHLNCSCCQVWNIVGTNCELHWREGSLVFCAASGGHFKPDFLCLDHFVIFSNLISLPWTYIFEHRRKKNHVFWFSLHLTICVDFDEFPLIIY